jgi:CRISPR-associated protein Csy1
VEVSQGLLAIKQNKEGDTKTSSKVKQVYFPVQDREYHLLSVMTPSNLMFTLKERIREMHFSEITKQARESKKSLKHHEKGFSEIYGLTVSGYGGTKPKNISVLNNQNHGEAYLLPSSPPQLADRKVQTPRTDFFKNSLWLKAFKDDFLKFHALLEQD